MRLLRHRGLGLILVPIALCGHGRAQGFNIDMGLSTHPVPPPTYGGAANQPGPWNSVDEASVPAFTRQLVDVGGLPTGAFVSVTPAFAGTLTSFVWLSGLSGDQAALYDDFIWWSPSLAQATINVTITGLIPGSYDIVCYPGSAASEGSFTPGTCTPSQICTFFDGTFTAGSVFGTACCSTNTGTFLLTIGTCGSPLSYPAIDALQLVPHAFSCTGVVTEPYCAANSAATCTCPCGNCGVIGRGCDNSYATGGGRLSTAGVPDVSSDSLVLQVAFVPPMAPVMFLQGTSASGNGFGAPFDDGTLCVGGTLTRLGVRFASAGSIAFGAGQGDDPLVSSAGGLPIAGGTRFYQGWYRDSQVFCAGGTSNLTNGYRVVWVP